MKYRIWVSPPELNGQEIELVKEAFASNYIAPAGPQLNHFENDLKSLLKTDRISVALNSGTSAIHLGLLALGVKPNDFVLCPSSTFIAVANPIKYIGAHPVFIDCDSKSWNIDPNLVEHAIQQLISQNKKPKVIIGVHNYGMPYDHEALSFISNKYDIPILEDSAEALGSQYDNKACGTLGNISVFSFNGNKIVTTSSGGALICQDKNVAKDIINIATQSKSDSWSYTHNDIGFNYRMSNVLAAIGSAQLQSLDKNIKARRTHFTEYQNAFERFNLTGQVELTNTQSNRWLSAFLFPNEKLRNKAKLELQSNGIESRSLWKPIHEQKPYQQELSFSNGNANHIFKHGLALPSGSGLTYSEREEIIAIIKSLF